MAAVSPVLVGRDAEIAVLGESWSRVRGGSPATVLIGGEAGIGKTRLVRHFTAGVEAEVLYGGCLDLSGGACRSPRSPRRCAGTRTPSPDCCRGTHMPIPTPPGPGCSKK